MNNSVKILDTKPNHQKILLIGKENKIFVFVYVKQFVYFRTDGTTSAEGEYEKAESKF